MQTSIISDITKISKNVTDIEKALYDINDHKKTKVVGSGRTDRGVHALDQTAHFDIDIDITLYKLKCALNSLLPEDIHVFSVEFLQALRKFCTDNDILLIVEKYKVGV